jgi:hypothetical protein
MLLNSGRSNMADKQVSGLRHIPFRKGAAAAQAGVSFWVQSSGFWVQKFQDLIVLFPITSDDLFLDLSNL